MTHRSSLGEKDLKPEDAPAPSAPAPSGAQRPAAPMPAPATAPQRDEFIRAENEDDDGYDPYSDRRPTPEPLFERDPWS